MIQNIIANPTFYNATQGTVAQMTIKTSLNAAARPGAILLDKNIDPHTKKFSASKEFLYQASSLLVYIALIVPIFKSNAFKIAKKYVDILKKSHIIRLPALWRLSLFHGHGRGCRSNPAISSTISPGLKKRGDIFVWVQK